MEVDKQLPKLELQQYRQYRGSCRGPFWAAMFILGKVARLKQKRTTLGSCFGRLLHLQVCSQVKGIEVQAEEPPSKKAKKAIEPKTKPEKLQVSEACCS